MFTLIYINGNLNRPDTLLSFLQSNVGKSPFLQVDCVTPYLGNEQDLIHDVCKHLNRVTPMVKVTCQKVHNVSTEATKDDNIVNFMVMQLQVSKQAN